MLGEVDSKVLHFVLRLQRPQCLSVRLLGVSWCLSSPQIFTLILCQLNGTTAKDTDPPSPEPGAFALVELRSLQVVVF